LATSDTAIFALSYVNLSGVVVPTGTHNAEPFNLTWTASGSNGILPNTALNTQTGVLANQTVTNVTRPLATSTVIRLRAEDRFGCVAYDSVRISVLPPRLRVISMSLGEVVDAVCWGDTVMLILDSIDFDINDPAFTILWTANPSDDPGVIAANALPNNVDTIHTTLQHNQVTFGVQVSYIGGAETVMIASPPMMVTRCHRQASTRRFQIRVHVVQANLQPST